MTTLYIETDTFEEITRPHDPEDEWSGEDTSTTWDLLGVHLSEDRGWRERIDVDFDVAVGDGVWVVFAVWSDGDSFSSREAANGECFGVYRTLIEAEDRERSAEELVTGRSPLALGWLLREPRPRACPGARRPVMTRRVHNGCSGKVRHAYRRAALKALARVDIVSLNVYKCPRCHGWHLGNDRSDFRTQQRIDQLLHPERNASVQDSPD